MIVGSSVLGIIAAVNFGVVAPGQVAQHRLQPPNARLTEPFSRVVGLAELPDGRVLVADPTEREVALVDFSTGRRTRVGRNGRGPGEYETPFAVVPLPGDTIAVYDGRNRRVLLVDPEGRPARTVRLPDALHAGTSLAPPKGADRSGAMYFERLDTRSGPPFPSRGFISRWHPSTGELDSLLALTVRDAAGRKVLRPFVTRDGWAVTSDGRIAMVTGEPYAVRWWADGTMSPPAPEVATPRIPIDDGEIEAYWREQSSSSAGVARSTAPPSDREGVRRLRADWEFPEYLPPFEADRVFAAPRGELWVVGARPWNAPNEIVDVFDREGRRMRQVILPDATRLVGFGPDSVYLVRIDDTDLQWLERYDLIP